MIESLEPRLLLTGYTAQALLAFPTGTIESAHTVVQDASGNLFLLGITVPQGGGTQPIIYEIAKGTTSLRFVASFATNSSYRGLAVDANDNVFTVNEDGGVSQKGSIVEIAAGTHTPVDIAFFDGTTTGSLPGPDLVFDHSGNLFGTTFLGAANNIGAVWELPVGTTTITPLTSFTAAVAQAGGSSFTNPQGLTLDSNGNIFGTIPGQQLNAPFGGIWELPASTSTINVIATFDGTNGNTPRGPLVIDAQGNVFGETSYGGQGTGIGYGTLFEIKAGSGSVTTLAFFNGTNGRAPMGGLITDANNNLFGTTNLGGSFKNGNASGDGTVFELPAGSATITTLVNLDGATTGSGPSNLVPDGNGNFYLATSSGGSGSSNSNNVPLNGALVFVSTSGGGGGGGGSATLAGAISSTTLDSTFVPGDHVNASITLTSTGAATKGVAHIQLYLSPDGVPADGVALTAPSLNHVSFSLASGASKKVTGSFVVPANVALGNEQLVAVVTSVSGFANTTVDSTPIVDSTVDTAALAFGAVGTRHNVHLSTTINGHKVTASLTGSGEGIFAFGNIIISGTLELVLTSTTAATKVMINSAPGLTVEDIGAVSALGTLSAPNLSVAPVLSSTVSFSGGIKSLTLGNVTRSSLAIGGSTPANLTLGDVVDTPIVSTEPFSSLAVKSYTNTGTPTSISVPSIKNFNDRGNFAGNIAAAAISTALIRGDLNGDILVGASFGADNKPGGLDDTFSAGTIGSIHILGNVNSSIIAAGLNVLDDLFPLDTGDALIAGSSIKSILIGGTLSADSKIVSAVLPTKVSVTYSQVTTASDPRFKLP